MNYSIELIGGPADGRVMVVPEQMLTSGQLRIPVAPSLSAILHTAGQPSDELLPPRPLTYEWDGTVREDGVRRFRLR